MDGAPRSLAELSGDVKRLLASTSASMAVPLELKLLGVLILLFLFLLFLIAVLWDRYGSEIGALYTGLPGAHDGPAGADANVNAVADEYTVYQKLPTFFYEYMPRKRKSD